MLIPLPADEILISFVADTGDYLLLITRNSNSQLFSLYLFDERRPATVQLAAGFSTIYRARLFPSL